MKKDISVIISIIAIVLSIVTIILFFVKVSPNSVVDSNTFIGVCTACIGIAVTFIIGYQIVNALQIKEKFSNLEEASTKLRKLYDKSRKEIQQQSFNMQEELSIIYALRSSSDNDPRAQLISFVEFHRTLILSVKTDETQCNMIFSYMKKCICHIDSNSFKNIYANNINGGPSRKLEKTIKDYDTLIAKQEKEIKKADGFSTISAEYNKVIELYEKRVSDILEDKLSENEEFWNSEESKTITYY
jgi:hypothetical protein